MSDANNTIAFQGEPGAFSNVACGDVYPHMQPLPCPTFEDTLLAVQSGAAKLAMIPVENSLYGRITDIHHLLPQSNLYIIAEYFLPIRMQLLGLPGAALEDIRDVYSLSVALGQCRRFIRDHNLRTHATADTAGSARLIKESRDTSRAAIGSRLAGDIYGLEVLTEDIEDAAHNTTRFLVMSRQRIEADPSHGQAITTFVFQVRNVPAALYKAMGGFATNGVNMIKLESYMIDGSFTATQFYADIEGHPHDRPVELALEELMFFTTHVKILGTYPMADFRLKQAKA